MKAKKDNSIAHVRKNPYLCTAIKVLIAHFNKLNGRTEQYYRLR